MRNYILNFIAGMFCLCFSFSLFAQTAAIKPGSGNQGYNEINSPISDSSFGFYNKHAVPKDSSKANEGGISYSGSSLNIIAASAPVPLSHSLISKNVTIKPNPAKDMVYVMFEATTKYRFRIEVASATGMLLQQKEGTTNKGANMIVLDTNSFANGIYLVNIVNDKGERKTVKLVKE